MTIRPVSGQPASADRAIERAIRQHDLTRLGWRGFGELPWVRETLQRYPEAERIASTCSSHVPGYLDQARELFEGADPADRGALKQYFLGKLALEELSCRRNGAGAGLCDKRAAFYQIWQTSNRY